jgi:hypothetical protein
MGKKKNLSKAKKVRKQLLSASAAGLILLSSVAGPSLTYAQEAIDKGKTETTDTTNKTAQTASSVAKETPTGSTESSVAKNEGSEGTSSSSSTSAKENTKTAKATETTDALQYSWNNFPSTNGPFKSGYTVKWPTIIGAQYKVVLTYATRSYDPINFNVSAKDVKVENSFVETSNPTTRHYTTTITFTANADTTNCKVTWTGYGPEVAGSTIAISASSNAPQSLLEHAEEINGYMSTLFKTDGSLQTGVTQQGIDLIRHILQQIVPQDSGYWTDYIEPNLQAASDLVANTANQIQTDLNSLYYRNGRGGLNSKATQSVFDSIQQRITALPSSNPIINQKKQALQNQLNTMAAMLQEIQLKSSTGQVVAQIDSNPDGTYVRTFAGTVPGNATIGKIQITHPMYDTYRNLINQEYKGGTYQDKITSLDDNSGDRPISGDSLMITTNEAPLAINGNVQLSNTVSKSYTFKMNDKNQWILQSSSYDGVKNAVDALFNGETPKPTNTQEQINQAKNQVNSLLDGPEKTALLAKITTAQQALDAANAEEAAKVKAATDAVNALFNGDTPKPENTQEQINAAKAKVEALQDGDTKTALLSKVQQAQGCKWSL